MAAVNRPRPELIALSQEQSRGVGDDLIAIRRFGFTNRTGDELTAFVQEESGSGRQSTRLQLVLRECLLRRAGDNRIQGKSRSAMRRVTEDKRPGESRL